ncbi:hypothetical protein FOLKNPGA_01856 [Legionella sp. PC1000]|uniref:hypothetical protein n=1 Tax=Legionella sp. PC1000 TaxID=2746060 RepID=UPI0015FD4711|nr:hypothetical protein [Legionella sp. PC1000]QLZ69074.1 hypothetical protein FOLKNPGA_01856 [Legionella sp. PC1000]
MDALENWFTEPSVTTTPIASPIPKQPLLLAWLGTQRRTDDATVFISSVVGDKGSLKTDAMETPEHSVQLVDGMKT